MRPSSVVAYGQIVSPRIGISIGYGDVSVVRVSRPSRDVLRREERKEVLDVVGVDKVGLPFFPPRVVPGF